VRYPWQFGLAILSVALGNTIVASIDLASDNAHRAFLRSTKTLTGRTTHRITGDPSSVLEEVFRRLYLELGGRARRRRRLEVKRVHWIAADWCRASWGVNR